MAKEIVIAAMIGALPALLALIFQRWRYAAEARKVGADASDVLTDTALELLKPLRERVVELERRDKERLEQIERQEALIRDLQQKVERQTAIIADVVNGAARLCHQVRSLGAQPVYTVPAYKP